MKTVALVGHPNSGKSTIFNQIAGYKTHTANFPGTTVELTKSEVRRPRPFIIIDLPGSYSLSSSDEAERETRRFLMHGNADVVVNVVDASSIPRSLNLTIELIELGVPLVVCLNMMDEARRKGLRIDPECLSKELGVPVVPTIATRGENLNELFEVALRVAEERRVPQREIRYSRDVEEVVKRAEEFLEFSEDVKASKRFLAVKALEGDPEIVEIVRNRDVLEKLREELEKTHGKFSDEVIISERHSVALRSFSKCVKIEKGYERDLREKIDGILTHRYFGLIITAFVMYALFYFVFSLGGIIEERLMEWFEVISLQLLGNLQEDSPEYVLVKGVLLGISGGVAIVLPYLIPFFIALSILEDVGYIPRVAFLLDGAFHRIGLHGGAVIPLVLGYGCSVPAVMATRTLGDRRERTLATALSVMIPCSARTVVILGLVGHFIGIGAALFIYILNIAVIVLAGVFLRKTFYGDVYGLIMEIPPLRAPSVKSTLMKTWIRVKEFIFIAFPILVAGSAVLSFLEFYRLDDLVNLVFKPLTMILGLPEGVGTTLIFGILRKELTLIMLSQVFGTYDFSLFLSSTQMMVFAVFTTFYVPCLSTIAVMLREIGKKETLMIILMTLSTATILGVLTRILFGLYFH